jgi:hypothetical protein
MRSRTASPDNTPPYARDTDFLFFAMCLLEYFCFARRGTCSYVGGTGDGCKTPFFSHNTRSRHKALYFPRDEISLTPWMRPLSPDGVWGPLVFFFTVCTPSLPPGVRSLRCTLLLVA